MGHIESGTDQGQRSRWVAQTILLFSIDKRIKCLRNTGRGCAIGSQGAGNELSGLGTGIMCSVKGNNTRFNVLNLYLGWAIDQCHHEARKFPYRCGKWQSLLTRRLWTVVRFYIA